MAEEEEVDYKQELVRNSGNKRNGMHSSNLEGF